MEKVLQKTYSECILNILKTNCTYLFSPKCILMWTNIKIYKILTIIYTLIYVDNKLGEISMNIMNNISSEFLLSNKSIYPHALLFKSLIQLIYYWLLKLACFSTKLIAEFVCSASLIYLGMVLSTKEK